MAAAPPPAAAPANAAPANPLGYPPKTQNFINSQARAGFAHDMYRRTGSSIIDRTSMAHSARIAAWRQPVPGAPPFRIAPPAGSAEARAQLAMAIANRGTVGSGIGEFSADLPTRRPSAFDQAFSQSTMNAPLIRGRLLISNMSFVKQLGWVSGTDRDLFYPSIPMLVESFL